LTSANEPGFSFALASGLEPGRELGRYRLVKRLGEGAFAEVWLAMEEGEHDFRKKVALKILKEATSDPLAYESLLNEARLCGMLHHLHIVDVFGVSKVDGLTFVAMEYVEGITLDNLLVRISSAGMTIPLSVVLEVGIGILEALDHSHNARTPEGEALNIVHRDLKPANVMLSPGIGVKVTDFGLAKATTNRNETVIGQVRGTPGYIAPEVWGGTRVFGPRVDLFAIGVLLWEMAVGQRMFGGSMIEVMGQCMHGDELAEMDTLRRHRPELVPVLERLLKRDPGERTSTAWEALVEMRELRDLVRAPGGLDLFLELLGVTRNKQRLAGARRSLAGSQDESWNQLMVMAGLSTPGIRAVPAHLPPLEADPPTDAMTLPVQGAGRRGVPVWLRGALVGVLVAVLVGVWWMSREHGESVVQAEESIEPMVAPPVPEPVVAAPEVTPSPPVEEVTPEEDPEPVAEPTPASKPPVVVAVVPTPEPAAVVAVRPPVAEVPPPVEAAPVAPALGCVVFQSSPVGATVLVGGADAGFMALSGNSVMRRYPPGPVMAPWRSTPTAATRPARRCKCRRECAPSCAAIC